MNSNEKISLIEAKFLNEKASEILTNKFMTKIRFHETKNFRSQVRIDKDDEIEQERIPELKNN
jgi:hypothetical protein